MYIIDVNISFVFLTRIGQPKKCTFHSVFSKVFFLSLNSLKKYVLHTTMHVR
jgi:hypothetical protein